MLRLTLTTLIGVAVFHMGVTAQIHVKSNGVGIGTGTPSEKFHVVGKSLMDASENVLNFNSPDNAWQYMSFKKGGQLKVWMGLTNGNEFFIKNEQPGNVYIQPKNGRLIIESQLDGGAIGGTLVLGHPLKIGDGQARDWAIYNMTGGYGNSLQFWAYGNTIGALPVLTLRDGGNVGIGTMAPEQKLHVNGTVKAYTYMADVPPDWPDYVFDTTFRLRPLPEVENYIQQNHHLPEVPSAETLKKNGLDLSDNQAVLLKKIEELTLYVIEQYKKIEALEAKMKALEKKEN